MRVDSFYELVELAIFEIFCRFANRYNCEEVVCCVSGDEFGDGFVVIEEE